MSERRSPRNGLTRAEAVEWIRLLRAEGWTHQQIADELLLSRRGVYNLLYDPTGEKQKRRRVRYQGVCLDCGGPTDGSDGRTKAAKRCAACAAARNHDERYWTRPRIIAEMWRFAALMGRPPRAADAMLHNPSQARKFSPQRIAEVEKAKRLGLKILQPSVVQREFGSWAAALAAAGLEFEPAVGGGHTHRRAA